MSHKSTQELPPRPPRCSREAPRSPKSRPRCSKEPQRAPKDKPEIVVEMYQPACVFIMPIRKPQEDPRAPKSAPRVPQGVPRKAQKAPKSASRASRRPLSLQASKPLSISTSKSPRRMPRSANNVILVNSFSFLVATFERGGVTTCKSDRIISLLSPLPSYTYQDP